VERKDELEGGNELVPPRGRQEAGERNKQRQRRLNGRCVMEQGLFEQTQRQLGRLIPQPAPDPTCIHPAHPGEPATAHRTSIPLLACCAAAATTAAREKRTSRRGTVVAHDEVNGEEEALLRRGGGSEGLEEGCQRVQRPGQRRVRRHFLHGHSIPPAGPPCSMRRRFPRILGQPIPPPPPHPPPMQVIRLRTLAAAAAPPRKQRPRCLPPVGGARRPSSVEYVCSTHLQPLQPVALLLVKSIGKLAAVPIPGTNRDIGVGRYRHALGRTVVERPAQLQFRADELSRRRQRTAAPVAERSCGPGPAQRFDQVVWHRRSLAGLASCTSRTSPAACPTSVACPLARSGAAGTLPLSCVAVNRCGLCSVARACANGKGFAVKLHAAETRGERLGERAGGRGERGGTVPELGWRNRAQAPSAREAHPQRCEGAGATGRGREGG